jgi:hypothetical protein
MSSQYRSEAERLEQAFADAYQAYRNHINSTPYPATQEEWAEHDRYRDRVSQASAEWGQYCSDNKHLR